MTKKKKRKKKKKTRNPIKTLLPLQQHQLRAVHFFLCINMTTMTTIEQQQQCKQKILNPQNKIKSLSLSHSLSCNSSIIAVVEVFWFPLQLFFFWWSWFQHPFRCRAPRQSLWIEFIAKERPAKVKLEVWATIVNVFFTKERSENVNKNVFNGLVLELEFLIVFNNVLPCCLVGWVNRCWCAAIKVHVILWANLWTVELCTKVSQFLDHIKSDISTSDGIHKRWWRRELVENIPELVLCPGVICAG